MPDSLRHDLGTVMGLDFGLRRIGIAVGNDITGTAQPVETIQANDGEPDWSRLDRLIQQWRPGCLILGQPKQDDQTHPLEAQIRAFGDKLSQRFALPLYEVNEQFSSRAAESHLLMQRQQGTRGRIKKQDIDALAAAMLVEQWLADRSRGDRI